MAACMKNAYLDATPESMVTNDLDDGDNWELLIDNLPPINSLECATVS